MRQSARDLLARIEDGFARFEIEFGTRRKVLADRYQMFRLSQHYHQVRKRFFSRYGERPRRAPKPLEDDKQWAAQFLIHEGGKLVQTSTNADICLREHPLLSGIIGLDLSTNKTMLKAPLPLDFWEFDIFQMRPFTKGDATSVHQFLQMLGLSTIERADVDAAIQRIARENAWRPQD